MVALFLRLKLRLIGGMLKRSVWQLIGIILIGLYALSIAVLVCVLLAALRFLPDDRLSLLSAGLALGATVAGVAHLVLPILFGADDSMAPQRFALYGVALRKLATGLGAAAFISPVAVAEIIAFVGYLVAMSRTLPMFIAGIFSTLAFLILLTLSSRIVVAATQEVFGGRRAKETFALIGFVLIMLVGVSISGVARLMTAVHNPLAQIEAVGRAASWTPWGATLALPVRVAQGMWAQAIGSALIALVSVAILIVIWLFVVRRAAQRPLPVSSGSTVRRGLGAFSRADTTPRSVIVARATTYWLRDNRYRMALISIILVPVILGILGALNGVNPAYVAITMCVSAVFFASFTVSNDFSYDNTAFGFHVLAGVRGKADVLARLRSPFLGCVFLSVLGPTLAFILGQQALAWVTFAAGVGIAGAGLGMSGLLMALLPYAVVAPGGNPMKTPKGSSLVSLLSQGVVMFAALVAVLPSGIGLLLSGWNGLGIPALIGGVVSLVIGIVCGVLSMHFAPKIYDARQLSIFTTIQKFANAE